MTREEWLKDIRQYVELLRSEPELTVDELNEVLEELEILVSDHT